MTEIISAILLLFCVFTDECTFDTEEAPEEQESVATLEQLY